MFYIKQILIVLIGLVLNILGLFIGIKFEPSVATFALGFIGTWIILDAYHAIRGGYSK